MWRKMYSVLNGRAGERDVRQRVPATNTVISSCRRRSTNDSVRSANGGSPGAVDGNPDRRPIQVFNLVRSVTFQPQTPKMRVNFFALNARI